MRSHAVLILLLPLMGTGTAMAQGVSQGTITGTLRDRSGGVVAGAAVTVVSDALIGGARTLRSAEDGTFRAPALAPGSYDVAANAGGFQPVRRANVALEPGATVTIDMVLDVAGLQDQVVVEATAVGVDVKSPAAPFRIDQTLLFNLPTTRDVSRLINLVPGIAADVAYGGSQRSNLLTVDGTNTTEPAFQDPQLRVNQNWVEQVHVAGLGAAAEYGGSTGVVANSVLRSGGNRTSGLVESWTIQPGWLANNTRELADRLQTNFASRQIRSWWETSAQVGGAIRRDRLWYFTGLQAARHDDTPAGYAGDGSRDEREWQWIGKLTAAVAPTLRVEGFGQVGSRGVDGEYIDRFTPLEASSDISADQTAWNLRGYWTLGSRTLVEFRHSGFDMDMREGPRAPRTRSAPAPFYDISTGVTTGTSFYYFDQQNLRHESTATLSHYFTGRGGSHDLKGGIELEMTDATQTIGYPGGAANYTANGQPYGIETWAGDIGTATTQRWSAFAQDSWSVAGRLTLSAGVRVDGNRGGAPSIGRVFSTTPVSPRIGLAWDVRRDHRTVARVHYGRYHDTIFSSRISQADITGMTPVTFSMSVDGQLVVQSQRTVPPFRIDPDMRHSGVDQ